AADRPFRTVPRPTAGPHRPAGSVGQPAGASGERDRLPTRPGPGQEPGRVTAARLPPRHGDAGWARRRRRVAARGRRRDGALAPAPPAADGGRSRWHQCRRATRRDDAAAGHPVWIPALPGSTRALGSRTAPSLGSQRTRDLPAGTRHPPLGPDNVAGPGYERSDT